MKYGLSMKKIKEMIENNMAEIEGKINTVNTKISNKVGKWTKLATEINQLNFSDIPSSARELLIVVSDMSLSNFNSNDTTRNRASIFIDNETLTKLISSTNTKNYASLNYAIPYDNEHRETIQFNYSSSKKHIGCYDGHMTIYYR